MNKSIILFKELLNSLINLNMKKTTAYFFILFVSFQLSAQTVEDKIDALLNAYSKDNKFNGSVLVAYKGNVLFQKGYGYKNVESQQVNDANTIYQIGSITKQITAAVIMQLHEEKKLSIQDKLSKYYPSFPNGDKITVEHLLTHTSGIYNYTNDTGLMKRNVEQSYSEDRMLAIFKDRPLDFEPGTKWNYSNSGYSLLGYIIQKVTKKPYEQVVRERILRPLGMVNSGFDFTHLKTGDKAQGYFAINGSTSMRAPIVDSSIAYAAGALYSTVGDLFKWESAISTNKILKYDSWKTVFTPYKNKYGYGWSIDSIYNKITMAHSGGIHGFSSFITRFPEDKLAVILLTNTATPTLSKISKSIAAIIYDQPYDIPQARVEIQLDETILKQYVGEYQLAPTFSIKIFLEGKQLKAQATSQPSFDLHAEKENLFFTKSVDAQIEFVKDDMGKIIELILHQNGMKPKGKKVK
jgi:CubicO group peptidase (beta-lactamase class C family)